MKGDVYCMMEKGVFDDAKKSGLYQPESIAEVGFIHCCSELHQLVEVANAFYASYPNVILTRIERVRLRSKILDEEAADERFRGRGETFPHIFGPLNMDAVVEAAEMPRDEVGGLMLPPQFGI